VGLSRDNNDNAALHPSLVSRVQFSHFLRSPLLFRGNRDCALRLFDRSINRSQVVDRLQTIRAYADGISRRAYRDRRKRWCAQEAPSLLLPSPPLFPPFFSIMNVRATEKSARHMAAKGRLPARSTPLARFLSRIIVRLRLASYR